jgi:outer membrane assembly lipoprotein YfiO
MRRCLPLLILLLMGARVCADPPAAEFKNGHWQAVAAPVPAAPVSDPQLDHMQQLLTDNDAKAAQTVGLYWIKNHGQKDSNRDRALFLIAQAKYHIDGSDDWIFAFYYCDELMDEYPESHLFYPALELQYQIADGYLNGHKNRLFGLPIVPMQEEAIEMLYRIQERSPGSPLAQKALLRTCDYYYSTGDYELAHDAYAFYIKNYPHSSDIANVKLRQAFSSLAQFHGVRFDPTPLIDARSELSDIITAYPGLAKEQNLNSIITRIDSALSRKLLVTADFYRRTHAPHGAVYVYRYLIDVYPDSSDAATAKKVLAGMPKDVLADAPPRPEEGFSLPEAPGKGTQ